MIIDILCFCFEHHAVHMRNYCISNKLLNRVLVLLKSKHHFLALSMTTHSFDLFLRLFLSESKFHSSSCKNKIIALGIVVCKLFDWKVCKLFGCFLNLFFPQDLMGYNLRCIALIPTGCPIKGWILLSVYSKGWCHATYRRMLQKKRPSLQPPKFCNNWTFWVH